MMSIALAQPESSIKPTTITLTIIFPIDPFS